MTWKFLENTQVSKQSISTQITRPDLNNHLAAPLNSTNFDNVIVAAPIYNELIDSNYVAAQTVTYDQSLSKMGKHQIDKNHITSNRKWKKKQVVSDINGINDDITTQTYNSNQFIEGIETLSSIN
ncbi:unnamed protein product [Rhizophagus irregularis]|nr:unnamed protein product [Rhizophagus irregularis]